MKKLSMLALILGLTLSSCSHFGNSSCGGKGQCNVKKEQCNKEQCKLKKSKCNKEKCKLKKSKCKKKGAQCPMNKKKSTK